MSETHLPNANEVITNSLSVHEWLTTILNGYLRAVDSDLASFADEHQLNPLTERWSADDWQRAREITSRIPYKYAEEDDWQIFDWLIQIAREQSPDTSLTPQQYCELFLQAKSMSDFSRSYFPDALSDQIMQPISDLSLHPDYGLSPNMSDKAYVRQVFDPDVRAPKGKERDLRNQVRKAIENMLSVN